MITALAHDLPNLRNTPHDHWHVSLHDPTPAHLLVALSFACLRSRRLAIVRAKRKQLLGGRFDVISIMEKEGRQRQPRLDPEK